MKVGKVIRGVLVAYLALGVAVVLAQGVATNVVEPECPGLERYTLAEGSGVLRIVTWLPDFYRETIAGEMTLKNYLLGGYQCEGEGLTLFNVESLRGFIQGVERPSESISAVMAKAAGGLPNAGKPGSGATALLDAAPKTIKIEDVSFELPGNWKEREPEGVVVKFDVKDNSEARVVREYESPDQPSTVLVRISVLSTPPNSTLASPEVFARQVLPNMEGLGLRNAVSTIASSIVVSAFPGIHLAFEGDAMDRGRWEYVLVGAYLPPRQVQLTIVHRIQPVSPYREAVDRARTSLKIGN